MNEIADSPTARGWDRELNWFRFHPATAVTGPIHDRIRAQFRSVALTLVDKLPDGPDKTVALRKLQDAMMSANACIANAQTPEEDAQPINLHSTDKGANP